MADVKIQTGTVTLADTVASATITAGVDYTAPASLSRAWIEIVATHPVSDGVDSLYSGQLGRNAAIISDPTTLLSSITFQRSVATNPVTLHWRIVEYTGAAGGPNEFVVRRTPRLSLTTTTATAAVTGVVADADVVPILTSVSDINGAAGRLDLQSALCTPSYAGGTLTATRIDTTVDVDVTYAVVEFTGTNWAVQRIEHVYTSADVNEPETLSVDVVSARSFIVPSMRLSNIADAGSFAQLIELTDTAVNFQIRSASTDAVGVVYVVESADATAATQRGSVTMTVTGAANQSVSQAVTPVGALDAARVVLTGGEAIGPDIGCALVGGQLSTTAQLDLHRGDASADALVNYEIFEFPTTSAADTTPPTISNPTLTVDSNTAVTFGATSDEDGTAHAVVRLASDPQASGPEIVNGTYANAVVVPADVDPITANIAYQFAQVTGLTGNTTYAVDQVATDAAGNISAVNTQTFTTQSKALRLTIDGGANRTYDFDVFSTTVDGTATIIKQFDGVTVAADGTVTLGLDDTSVTSGTSLEGLGKDTTTGDPVPVQGTVTVA